MSYLPSYSSVLLTYSGGRLVSVAIGCIWPQWRTIPNSLPVDAAITTTQLSGFIIFMLVFISLAFVHSRDLKPLYYIKSVYVSLAMHAVLIWFAVKAGGLSLSDLTAAPPTMSTTQRAWLCLQAFNVGLGTASSLSVNQGDMARYANKPNAQLWVRSPSGGVMTVLTIRPR
jgi:NCS1 family nucleobase:cation symporter-1